MRRILIWLGALLTAGATTAWAHPAPFSYIDVRIQPGVIDAAVVVHVFDVAHDLSVADSAQLLGGPVLAAKAPDVVALVRDRLRLSVDGAAASNGVWAGPEPMPERQSLRVRVQYRT